MSDLLNIYCGIEGCEQNYKYVLDEAHPVALEGGWWAKLDSDEALAAPPEPGNTYVLKLENPVQLSLDQPFWALWMNPLAYFNGIESEADIASMRFCRCEALELIESNRQCAKLRVRVSEVLGLQDHRLAPETEGKLEKKIRAGGGIEESTIDLYGDYCHIWVNHQGDVGEDDILVRRDGSWYWVANCYWDFHEHTWQMRNERLSRELQEKYGL